MVKTLLQLENNYSRYWSMYWNKSCKSFWNDSLGELGNKSILTQVDVATVNAWKIQHDIKISCEAYVRSKNYFEFWFFCWSPLCSDVLSYAEWSIPKPAQKMYSATTLTGNNITLHVNHNSSSIKYFKHKI